MKSLHRGGLLDISLVFFLVSLMLPRVEGFFFNLHGMNRCCAPMPPCCNTQQLQPSGFGSQLYSSYGVGRTFRTPTSYATAPRAAGAYPLPPAAHPWAQQMQQHLANHAAAAQQHWNAHQAKYPMASLSAFPAAQPVTTGSNDVYPESTTSETTTTFDEATFFGDNQIYGASSPAPPPISAQIDEEPTTMYSTDYTTEPMRAGPTPSGYTFTAPPLDPTVPVASIQVESASSQMEVGGYLRSKPPKLLVTHTQAVDEFSETATWAPAQATTSHWQPSADQRQPQLAFSADAQPVQHAQQHPFAAAPAPAKEPLQPQGIAQLSTDLSSSELKELDDLDMLLITSDESFRPVTSQNPARPLTSEERAGFSSNDISKIADGLPPDLSDVIFWPIGKDITLLKRAIALRRRRDEEARRRRSMEGSDPPPKQKHRSEPQRGRMPSTEERISSFLAHYFRRRAPSGDSRRVLSGGQSERAPKRTRSAKTARDMLRSSILEKILAMEELLAVT